jgi:hypothetical protein
MKLAAVLAGYLAGKLEGIQARGREVCGVNNAVEFHSVVGIRGGLFRKEDRTK